MRALAFVGLMATAVVFFACGDDSETTDTDAGEGEACEQGFDCQDGLMCFIPVEDQPGECLPIPAACGDDPDCTGDCLDDFKTENCAGGSSCLSTSTTVTLTCIPEQ